MFQSLRYSQILLRIGLAAVYFWFGIDKFVQPEYWIDAWMPVWAQQGVQTIGMSPANAVIFIGIFEVLVATSLITGFFMRAFAALAGIFLLMTLIVHGLNAVLVRDVGLIFALAALMIWPERRYA